MLRFCGFLIAGVLLSLSVATAKESSSEVRNIKLFQNSEGEVVIEYDLPEVESSLHFAVSLVFSTDGGQTFDVFPRRLRGDVGNGIAFGSRKRIVWDAKNDLGTVRFEKLVARVFAVSDTPYLLGIAMDTSGSMRRRAKSFVAAANALLSSAPSGSQYFLVCFSNEVRLVTNLTRDPKAVSAGLSKLRPSGSTALYDAIYVSVEKAQREDEERKAVVVFTDGDDSGSYYGRSELRAKGERIGCTDLYSGLFRPRVRRHTRILRCEIEAIHSRLWAREVAVGCSQTTHDHHRGERRQGVLPEARRRAQTDRKGDRSTIGVC